MPPVRSWWQSWLVRSRALVVVVLLAACTGCSACGSSVQPTELPPPPVTVTSISISGLGESTTVGEELSARLTASLSDQTTQDVTSQATWETSDAAVATVSSSGVVTTLSAGECSIRAVYRNVSASTRLSVAPRSPGLGTIAGVVSDSVSGRPVVGARVTVVDGSDAGRASQTDDNGYYSLGGVVNGALMLRVVRDGYSQADIQATVLGNTRTDIQLRPLPPPPYTGVYNVTFSVAQDTCRQVTPAATGQVQLSGTATTVTVRIVERGITRSYNGTIAGDGSFSAVNGAGSTSSAGWGPAHDYSGNVTGRVTGDRVTGTERLNFTSGCPGQVLVINFGGAR